MTTRRMYLTALALGSFLLTGHLPAKEQATKAVLPPETRQVDPAAIEALHRMGTYLRGLESFELKAEDMLDEVLESGQKIQLTKTVDLLVHKPNRLRADIATDRKAREIYYDGEHFTVYSPDAGFFATVAAPPTIRELLAAVKSKYGIELPLEDLFYWGEDEEAEGAIKEAMSVGPSNLGGRLTDHYAFRQDDVDWQIWIAQGDIPLPLRYVITTKDMPGEPQYMANLTWSTEVNPEEARFVFTPTKEDHPIDILVRAESQATPDGAQQ